MSEKPVEKRNSSIAERLGRIVQEALTLSKKAKKNNQSLSGDNFYGQKLAALKAEATNLFTDLTGQSTGDVSAMAEMIAHVFDQKTLLKERKNTASDLLFSLRTTWRSSATKDSLVPDPIFPMVLLAHAKRGYLTVIGRQMNDCFRMGYYDASAVMMRRLLEVSIIEAFEARNIASKIKDVDGNYLHLTDMVKIALSDTSWTLSRNTKKVLPQLRDIGHLSAHARYYTAQESDIVKIQQGVRIVIEEFLHLAKLL